MITNQTFSATVYLNLPEGVVILSPGYSTPDGTPRYRMVATSNVSTEDAIEKLIAAAKTVALDVQS